MKTSNIPTIIEESTQKQPIKKEEKQMVKQQEFEYNSVFETQQALINLGKEQLVDCYSHELKL